MVVVGDRVADLHDVCRGAGTRFIPGGGMIGREQQNPHGFVADQSPFYGANADLNLTFAMALIFCTFSVTWALQELGPGGFLLRIVGRR